MAKFAPVVPARILQEFKNHGVMGDYHLLLAHDIVKHPKEYEDLFLNDPMPKTVILDNSVIELGGAVDLAVIIEAAAIVKPTTIVLPDVLTDTQGTIDACSKALNDWTDGFAKGNISPQFMIVPQGKSEADWIRCAEYFADDPRINFWGIPRLVVEYNMSRYGLATLTRAFNPNRTIHLLGFSNCVQDDIFSASNPHVFGIDSAVPIRAVTQKVPLTIAGLNNMPPRGDWFEAAQFNPEMLVALHKARQWFK